MFKLGTFTFFLIIGLMIIPVNFVSAQMDNSFSPCGFPLASMDTKTANQLISCFEANPNIVNDFEGFAFAVGTAYHELNNNEKSIFYYKLALEQDYTNGDALALLCYVYLDEKEYAVAYDYASRAVNLGYDDIGTTICLDSAEQGVRTQENKKASKIILEEPIVELEAQEKVEQERITQLEPEEKGGCLIATATYGSELAPQVQQLRELRDNTLLNTASGTAFMGMFNDVYYSFSPTIADMERENPMFKEVVKLGLTPMISSLSLMENADSESEVLGLGLSVIALNLGMYIALPAFGIIKVIQLRKN
jgi:tetratricopeptide (TPR) repeat protein